MIGNVRWKIIFFCFLVIFPLAGAGAWPATAAHLGDISVMEEFSAGLRATAAMDPDEKIRNPDTMAHQFLSRAFWFWSMLDEDYTHCMKFIRFYRVSAYYGSNACTKHIDGILQKAAQKGIQQVVNIGAGLDSRPYRFGKQMPTMRFFEVDLPVAVARKKEIVAAAVGQLPETVAYIPIDYRSHAINGDLNRAGYEKKLKTLFICERVTQYVDATAVDRIMQFIAENAAPGSELVFDYILGNIARGDYSQFPYARLQAIRVASYGYPWKFGIAPEKAAEFVNQKGFAVISDLGAEELARQYLVRSDGNIDGKPTPYFRIIHAVLKK
jgi:methyltransferase (TIGR00027 family)